MQPYWDEETIIKIRQGYYSAVYFNRTQQILLAHNNLSPAMIQIFQKKEAIVCGIDEVISLLQTAAGYWSGEEWIGTGNLLTIHSLSDGDGASPWEPVMQISGPYAYIAHLESLYLGILAQRTLVATHVHQAVRAAKGKDVIFFADRFDSFLNQPGNGYAAHIGGAKAVCTQAHTAWLGGQPVGTIPHALIAMYEGNTIAAAEAFTEEFPNVPLIVLGDFTNDCVNTSLQLAKKLGKRLWGVRLDTSENMIDASFKNEKKKKEFSGVHPNLVSLVRKKLNDHGFSHVKIVVSGGFTPEKIQLFEKEHLPVDVYGVGSAMIHGENDFTADIVRVDGKDMAKAGRRFISNERLKQIFSLNTAGK